MMIQEHEAPGEQEPALIALLDGVLPRYAQVIRHILAQDQGEERLTLPQLRLLQALARTPTGTALTTHLARHMDVTVPTMTSRIDGLVERGFVERRPDPDSRRQIQLVLTPTGQAHLERCERLIHARLHVLLAPLSEPRRERLRLALEDLDALLATAGAAESTAEGD